MKSLKISPKRSLGQNFLINDSIVSSILKAANPGSFEKVFEVGPGLGALTDSLKEKSKNLILLEFDKKLSHFWEKQGLDVKQVNALCFNWKEHLKSGDSKLLVSNLPYQIASRLLVELSTLKQSFNRMVLMFQKEVAQRILADPGTRNYGFLTVMARTFWNTRPILKAGTVDFFPKPGVASQVLCFDRKKQAPSNKALHKLHVRNMESPANTIPLEFLDPPRFSEFVKKAFLNRRKKLLPKLTDHAEKIKVLEIFKKMKLDEGVRAENVTPEQFVELALRLKKR